MGLFTKNYMKYFPDGFTLKTRLSSKVAEYQLVQNNPSTQWFIIGKIVNGSLVTSGTEDGYTWSSWLLFDQFNEELKQLYSLKKYVETIGLNLAGLDPNASWWATRDDLIAGWSIEDSTENRQIYDDIFLRHGYSNSPDATFIESVIGFWRWLLDDLDSSFDTAIEREQQQGALISVTVPSKMYDHQLTDTIKGISAGASTASAILDTSQDFGGVSGTEIDVNDLDNSLRAFVRSVFPNALFDSMSFHGLSDMFDTTYNPSGKVWGYKITNTVSGKSTILFLTAPLNLNQRDDSWVAYCKNANDEITASYRGANEDWSSFNYMYTIGGLLTYGDVHDEGTFYSEPVQYIIQSGGAQEVILYLQTKDETYTPIAPVPESRDLIRLSGLLSSYSNMDYCDLAGADLTNSQSLFQLGILEWEDVLLNNKYDFDTEGGSESTNANDIRDPLNSDGSLASEAGAGIIVGAIGAVIAGLGYDSNGDFASTIPSITNKDDALDYLDDLAKNTGFFTGQPDEYLPTLPWGSNELFTIWNVDWSDLADLGHYLWTHNWDLSHMFMSSSPSDAIISLSAFPVEFVNLPKMNFHMAGQTFQKQIEVVGNAVGTFDCGKITISEFYKSFLDYNPYTKVTAYLPFIGFVDLNVDDLIGATSIHLKYRIEFLTGNCLATITVERPNFKVCFYQYSGNCAIQIPLTGSRQSNALLGLVAGAGGVAGAIASGNPMFAIGGAQALEGIAKKEPTRSGSMQGNVGLLGNMQPYVIIERKVPNNSEAYSALVGRPSNDYKAISECSGFVQFSDFKLNNLKCNDSQKSMIETLLRNGIFID